MWHRRGVLAGLAGLPLLGATSGEGGTARPVTALTDAIGVNTHINYSDGDYGNITEVARVLSYLGVRLLRDAAPYARYANQWNYGKMAAWGYRFCFVTQPNEPLPNKIAALANFVRQVPRSIEAIEGVNEVNNQPKLSYRGLTGIAAGIAFQQDLYAAVRAEPALAGIPVYNMTGTPQWSPADYGNAHPYPKLGAQAIATLRQEIKVETTSLPGKPMVFTEAGYHTLVRNPRGWEGVDGPTHARLTLNLLFDAVAMGVKRVYLYQLLDAYADPTNSSMEKHFGLFDHDFRPKPAATAIRNLLLVLRAGSATAAPPAGGGLAVRSLDPLVGSLQLDRKDGARALILYRRAKVWDAATDRPVYPASTSLTVTANGYTRYDRYEPMARSTPVRGGVSAAGLIDVSLGADPVVLLFRR